MSKAENTSRQSWKALKLDWIGQMAASVFWAASVFVYGITSTGDVLQLCAALAWMVANIAAFMKAVPKTEE